VIGNKQKSIKQDYLAINKRSYIHNLRSSCHVFITEECTQALFYFCSSIDFLPPSSLFLSFLFFERCWREPDYNISRDFCTPKAALWNQKSKEGA
jgi:hypothetical protein